MNACMVELRGEGALPLAAEAWGDPAQPPVLLSHGGGQTRHSWRDTARILAARGWYVLNYDHRGHGDSAWSPDGDYSLALHAADQRAVARSFATPPVLVGASLGGLSALLAQGEWDGPLYRAIVLVDITPRMNEAGAREILDFMEGTARDGFASLDEAADVIARYTGRKKRMNAAGLEKNLRLGEDGKYRWHWDPSILSLRGDATGQADRLENATRKIDLPMLLIRGRESNVVTEETARHFLQLRPDAAYVDVADARHMVVGDRNEIFTRAVIEFIDSLD